LSADDQYLILAVDATASPFRGAAQADHQMWAGPTVRLDKYE
jgi:hypothetical protein